jgi:uncharacterized membrane protein YjdF
VTPSSFLAWSAVGFTAFAAARGDRRVIAYLVVVGVLAVAVRSIHRRFGLSTSTVWALAAAGVLHMAGGLLPSPDPHAPVLYETWLVTGLFKYDQITHFTVTAVVTMACFQVLARLFDANNGPGVRAAVAAVMGVGLGAGNEVFEFLAALRYEDAFVGGLDNVGWDLVFNLAGATSAAMWLGLRQPDRRRTPRPSDAPPRPGTARAGTS